MQVSIRPVLLFSLHFLPVPAASASLAFLSCIHSFSLQATSPMLSLLLLFYANFFLIHPCFPCPRLSIRCACGVEKIHAAAGQLWIIFRMIVGTQETRSCALVSFFSFTSLDFAVFQLKFCANELIIRTGIEVCILVGV